MKKYRNRIPFRCLVSLTISLLAACEPAVDPAGCVLVEKNYLGDPDFALEAKSGKSKYWTGLQHVGERSYVVSIADDGVLSIERTGPEPWFVYRQILEATDLAGELVAFSAEMRLVNRPVASPDRATLPAGLKLAALDSGKLRMRAEQPLSAADPPEAWQKVQLIARLPADINNLRLNFYHEAYGVLQVRAPSFQLVDPASMGCELTPVRE